MTQASAYSVKDLAQFMKREHENENGKPFVFFTGAGCSVSAGIPLAGKLIEEMNRRYELELKVLSPEDRKDYGKCMAQIGRDERRTFLKEYIQQAKINWAHIALASLLESGYISRVLTFNFDNLLARSCGLLGLYPATYDLTAANLNLYGLIDNPAIVHLHGQSHGFVQLNSNEETLEHAESLKSFICSTLNSAPTVFIGYSGLADAFFNNIESNFVGQHRLFWVGMEESPLEHVRDLIAGSSLANYMRCADGADLFLIELAQALGCFPPAIFKDPYQHLLDELSPITDYPEVKRSVKDKSVENDQHDVDILIGLKERLKKAKKNEVRVGGISVLDLYLQGKYQLLVDLAINNQKFDVADRVLVAKSFIEYAITQEDNDLEIGVYDQLIRCFGGEDFVEIREQVGIAYLYKAFALNDMERLEDEIVTYDEMLEYFNSSPELVLQEQVADALINKGVTLGRLNLIEEEIAVYDELIARFGTSTELVLQEQVAKASVNMGVVLDQLNHHEKAISVYDDLIARFGTSAELALQVPVIQALINKGVALSQLNRYEEAIYICDDLIARFSNSTEALLQDKVAQAKNGKGFTLFLKAKANWSNQPQALAYLQDALALLQQAQATAVDEQQAMLLGNLSYVYWLLGDEPQAKIYLAACLERGGEQIYQATLQDIATHPIPPDESFRALLEELWQAQQPTTKSE